MLAADCGVMISNKQCGMVIVQ